MNNQLSKYTLAHKIEKHESKSRFDFTIILKHDIDLLQIKFGVDHERNPSGVRSMRFDVFNQKQCHNFWINICRLNHPENFINYLESCIDDDSIVSETEFDTGYIKIYISRTIITIGDIDIATTKTNKSELLNMMKELAEIMNSMSNQYACECINKISIMRQPRGSMDSEYIAYKKWYLSKKSNSVYRSLYESKCQKAK